MSGSALLTLLHDICSYRNRREAMWWGAPATHDLEQLAALGRRLRAGRRQNGVRAFERFDCSVRAVLSLDHHGPHDVVRVDRISAEGASIRHQLCLEAGRRVRLCFALPSSSVITFDFGGQVLWVRKELAGIMFVGGADASISAPARNTRVGQLEALLDLRDSTQERRVAA